MPDFKLVSSETIPLTKEVAEKHHALEPSPTEREINPGRIKFLKKKLDDGLFISPLWSVARYMGRTLRMNGQHSSLVLSQASEIPAGLKVHLDIYEVTSRGGLAELFRQFDARQSSRSPVDVCGAYLGIVEELRGVKPGIGKLAAEGICWQYEQVEGVPSQHGDDIGQVFERPVTHPFVLWMSGLNWSKFPEGRNKGLVAAMWSTFQKNSELAKEFWEKVIHDTHEDEDEPIHRLSTELVAIYNRDGRWGENGAAKPGTYYGLAGKAWNAYRSGKLIKRLDFNPKKESPGAIEIAA